LREGQAQGASSPTGAVVVASCPRAPAVTYVSPSQILVLVAFCVLSRPTLQRCCIHPRSPLHGIVRVTSLKVLGVLTDCLSLCTWMTSSARVRDPCMPLACCGFTAWRRQLYSRCSARSSSLSSLTPLRRGGASRPPSTDSISMLFCVELLELLGLTCGQWLGRLTRLRSRTSATQLMTNCSPKLELSPTTFYTHFCHRHPPHHRTTV